MGVFSEGRRSRNTGLRRMGSRPSSPWVHRQGRESGSICSSFLFTLLTTIFAGALQEGVNPFETPGQIYRGIPFSFSLMGILLSHEFGHYLAAKRHGLNVTLPYFIPAPPIIGTFGAFIKMRSLVRDRRMLMDVGAAGPLVGVVVAIPLLIAGLRLSEVKLIQGEAGMNLGSSLLLSLLSRIVVGPLPEGYDIVIHPVGFAGWIGLLVTALNLLPVGQLDGGHVAYALFGEWQNRISKIRIWGADPPGDFRLAGMAGVGGSSLVLGNSPSRADRLVGSAGPETEDHRLGYGGGVHFDFYPGAFQRILKRIPDQKPRPQKANKRAQRYTNDLPKECACNQCPKTR